LSQWEKKVTADIPGFAGGRSLLGLLALLLSLLAIAMGWRALATAAGPTPGAVGESTIATAFDEGVLNVGYGGFPPYTIVNPADPSRPTGFSVDLVEEIARRSGLRVQWHLFSWETIRADLSSGDFDFIADPVYLTMARARDVDFTRPYTFVGIGAGVVRRGDDRFQSFMDLNQTGVRIALAEGWTTTEFAEQLLDLPDLFRVSVTGEASNQLDEVSLGRADVALNDVPTILQYVQNRPELTALFVESPPSRVAGAFVVRPGDDDLRRFLNEVLEIFIADGTLLALDERWSTFGEFPVVPTVLGSGVRALREP
jgi:ABC-type amino acid transport substrate-binding protein